MSYISFSQNDTIQHIITLLTEEKDDTLRIDLYNRLSFEYYSVDIDKTFEYGEKALELSQQFNYIKGEAVALNRIALGHAIKNDDLAKAIDLNKQSLDIAMQSNDTTLMVIIHRHLGIAYDRLGMYEEALMYHNKTIEIIASDNYRDLKPTYWNLSKLHSKIGNKELSESYIEKYKEVAVNFDDLRTKVEFLVFKGEDYLENGELDKALIVFQEAEAKSENSLQQEGIQKQIISILKKLKLFERAEQQFFKKIQMMEAAGYREGLLESNLEYAVYFYEIEAYQKCKNQLNYIMDRFELADIYNEHSLDFYNLRSKLLSKFNSHQSAYQDIEKVLEIKDSLNTLEQSKLMAELDIRYQLKNKDKENDYLKSEKEKNEIIISQNKEQRWLLFAMIGLFVFTTIVSFWAFYDKKRFNVKLKEQVLLKTNQLVTSNEQLKASNTELERFAYIASHDLKEPLRNINSFSYLLEQELNNNSNSNAKEYLGFITKNSIQMNHLVQDVLEYSRLEDNSLKLEKTDTKEVLSEVTQSLDTVIKEKNVQIEIAENLPKIDAFPSQIYLVFKNLITNGIKFNESDFPRIHIEYFEKREFHHFAVRDNGIGIPEIYDGQIFEMFKRLHNREEYQGTGLGLAICKKIITNLGGKIWLDTNASPGAKICFTIPKKNITIAA